MFGNKTTRQIVTNKRSAEQERADTMVQGRSPSPGEQDDPTTAGVEEATAPTGRKWPKRSLRFYSVLLGVVAISLLFVVLIMPGTKDSTIPVVSDGQAVVAVPADSMLTNEVIPGDIVRLYNNDGVLMDELQYVQVYDTEAGGLLLLMDDKQAAVMVKQKDAPKVVLVIHNDPTEAAKLLDLQARINDPQITLGLQPTVTMAVGETREPELQTTIDPIEATLPEVQWISSDPAVATVEDGIITAKGVGQATITAVCGDVEATCAVTVEIPLAAIVLSQTEAVVAVGETVSITAAADPEDTTHFDVIWSTEDPAVATVAEDGTVTGVAVGTTTITASSGDISASCTVTVGVHAEVAQLDKTSLTIEVGKSEELVATVYPSADVIDTASFKSSDNSIASVNSEGKVTGCLPGSVTISYCCGEAKATCDVVVIEPDFSPEE